MSLTFEQANDEMQTMLKDAWDLTGHELFYDAVRDQRETDNSPWAVVSIRHSIAGQATLGGIGNRLFQRDGTIIVQIYTPVGNGLQESYQLAKIAVDVYEGKSSPGGVWFRNVRVNEIGADGMFYQTNVLIEFQYDEQK